MSLLLLYPVATLHTKQCIFIWKFNTIYSFLWEKQETAEDGIAGLRSKFQNLNEKVNQG